jgi:hypothetical protein
VSETGNFVSGDEAGSGRLTIEGLAECCGVRTDEIHELLDYGVIEPCGDAGAAMAFDATAVLRVRSVQRLRSNMGVNLYGVALVLEMSERIRALQREVEWLRNQL